MNNRRFLLLSPVLLAIPLLFYTLSWYSNASTAKESVEKNLAHAKQGFAAQGVTFTYGEIRSQGFPFNLKVRIMEPAVKYEKPGRIMMLRARHVDVVIEHGDAQMGYLSDPVGLEAVDHYQNNNFTYQLKMNIVPLLALRTPTQKEEDIKKHGDAGMHNEVLKQGIKTPDGPPDLISEFALNPPRSVIVTIQYATKTRELAFRSHDIYVKRKWWPLTYAVGGPMDTLFGLITQSVHYQ